MPVLTVGETRITYNLHRSKVAKSARLSVTPEGIDLVVPDWASDEDIAGVLQAAARLARRAEQGHYAIASLRPPRWGASSPARRSPIVAGKCA
jgi:predicted metal-dependent hydrolase